MQSPWTAQPYDNRPFLIVALGLVLLAWASLIIWGMSPYARYLDHDALDLVQFGSTGYLLWIFIGGWALMVIAMMLPTSLPLMNLYRSLVSGRSDRNWLLLLLGLGYLAVWVGFGVVAHMADLGLHRVVDASAALAANSWVITAGVFGLAGAYQFTSLKYRCLDECRSPLSFITSYWHGHNEWRNAFSLGIHHGIFCVGCCWSLMLLMFAVGHGNLGWMLLLGVVMGAEKNLTWGRRLAQPLGIVLLIGAGLIVAVSVL